ncbi:hypothetical protein MKS88_002636 [Plasmodium brasilianum]|uniref:Uncharacterized protein n=1 Tax=Plasmodium brasilianum TaxID=5824 RepID=A0ACB9YAR7_PLABR|nr:hypothetical protein MKS88_002636 [Plasmodium brasilianum]
MKENIMWLNKYSQSLDKKYNFYEKLSLTTNILLVEDSLYIKSTKVVHGKSEKVKLLGKEKDISNDNDHASKSKKLKESSLNTKEGDNIDKKKRIYLIKGIDIFFEKKIFNLLDSIYKIKYNRKNSKTSAYIMICKNIGLAVTPPFLILLSVLVVILMLCYAFFKFISSYDTSSGSLGLGFLPLALVYSLFLVLVSVLNVLSIIYTLTKIVKYNMIKEKNH